MAERIMSCYAKHVREDDKVLAVKNLKLLSISCKKCYKYLRVLHILLNFFDLVTLFCYSELITRDTLRS